MRGHVLGFAVLGFLFNPYACSAPADDPYQYGASELRAAVEGTWDFTLTTPEGQSAEFSVELRQGGAPAQTSTGPRRSRSRQAFGLREAHACGTRSFIATAEACIDMAEMPLGVRFVEGDRKLGSAVIWQDSVAGFADAGTYRVYSLVFSQGTLSVQLGDLNVEAEVASDGRVLAAHVTSNPEIELALSRRVD